MAAQYLDQTAKHLTEKAVCILPLTALPFAPSSFSAVNLVYLINHLDCDKICAINSSFFDDDCFYLQLETLVVLFQSTEGGVKHLMHELNVYPSNVSENLHKMCFTQFHL